ncbi:MAG: flagellar biosynthetic protein FliR [Thermodesulfobacteriota bacterium]
MVDSTLLNWTLNSLLTLVIVLIRVGPLLFFMPVLGATNVPNQVKTLLVFAVSLVLAPSVAVNSSQLPTTTLGFTLFSLNEICFAAILAFFARLIFDAIQLAGQMVSIQMGMSMAGVMDPQFGNQVTLVGQLWTMTAFLIFLAIDGHHIFFTTLVESYKWVKPGSLHLTEVTYNGILGAVGRMFILAIKIMAPASAAIFFSHIAMGIIAKTVPQIPILIVGMPMNIVIGLLFVGLSMGYFLPLMIGQFEILGRSLPRLAQGMG